MKNKLKKEQYSRRSNAICHGDLFKSLIVLTQAKTIVEIGVAFGSTTEWLCKGAKLVNGHVYGFDIWETYSVNINKEYENDYDLYSNSKYYNVSPCFGSTKEITQEFLIDKGYNNFTLIQTDTQHKNFLQVLKDVCPVIDFAFVDGRHSYNAVKNDFFNIYQFLSKTGIIALHDTFKVDGCREFILDLRTKYDDGTFDIINLPFGHGNEKVGISILVKRSYSVIKDNSIRQVQGSLSLPDDILCREKKWYDDQIKGKKK